MRVKIHPTAIVLAAFFIWNKSFVRLLASVILHELGHALAAFILGRRSMVLTLTPLGCSLYVGELSGPAVSLLLAPVLSPQTLWVLAFNLLPVLPLDGGRVTAAIFGERRCRIVGGYALLAVTELCALYGVPPVGLAVILFLHNRYLASAEFIKIRRTADFLRDLY